MNAMLKEKPQHINLTVREIFHVMYVGKKYNDAKVTLHVRDGVRWLCIHRQQFDTLEAALNYLREDGRNIVAPENRAPITNLEVVS